MTTTVREFIEKLNQLPKEASLCIDQAFADEEGIQVINLDDVKVEQYENEENMFLIFGVMKHD